MMTKPCKACSRKSCTLHTHVKEGRFENNFASIFSILGMKLSPGKEVLWRKICALDEENRSRTVQIEAIVAHEIKKKVALYVENRHDSSLRANVYRIMNNLGPSWGLYIIHSSLNEHYLKSSLKNVENVQFQNIEDILAISNFIWDEKAYEQ